MSLGLVESQRDTGLLSALRDDLIQTIKAGQWRDAIICRDKNGKVLSIFFPQDSRYTEDTLDKASFEWIPDCETGIPGVDESQTIFAHLGLDHKVNLIADGSQNRWSQPVKDRPVTKIIRDYLKD